MLPASIICIAVSPVQRAWFLEPGDSSPGGAGRGERFPAQHSLAGRRNACGISITDVMHSCCGDAGTRSLFFYFLSLPDVRLEGVLVGLYWGLGGVLMGL